VPDELSQLKNKFDVAMAEYITAIKCRNLALSEAMNSESQEIHRRYQDACRDEEAKADAYHKAAEQLGKALRHRK
jgi:hypothetical protein